MNALEKAEQLKNELDDLRPLDAEAEARIMQKFRLDWNYHSNNLEGNSLTYGETKALILFGITAQGKPLKDHFEITGHNEAINWILEIVKDKTVLTESFIRQLHTLLLKETSYKEAKTSQGKPTRRKIEVGKYKTQPNHVVTVTGETFYFATPEETPAKMQELIEWFRKEKEKADANPIILTAVFHYRFIRIHPFDDGNGRTARILMNFILMQFGYPPAIIKTEDKENYYAVLRLADTGELEPFIEYITENLIRSLEIMIRGAKGEDIEEPEDLDKELALLERRFEKKGEKVNKLKSKESIKEIVKESLPEMIEKFLITCQKFDRFYLNSILKIETTKESPTMENVLYYSSVYEADRKKFSSNFLDVSKKIVSNIILEIESGEFENLVGIKFDYHYKTFNRKEIFGEFGAVIIIEFDEKSYLISSISGEPIRKLYSSQITDEEISKIIQEETNRHKEFLEEILSKDEIKPLP